VVGRRLEMMGEVTLHRLAVLPPNMHSGRKRARSRKS
jgi:hypothetical protein